MLVTLVDVTRAANDKQQLLPLLKGLNYLPPALGTPSQLIADTGQVSASNVHRGQSHDIELLLVVARDAHHRQVFGIIKHVMGCRQFSLRGLDNVSGEWRLVALSWNIKRMHRLMAA